MPTFSPVSVTTGSQYEGSSRRSTDMSYVDHSPPTRTRLTASALSRTMDGSAGITFEPACRSLSSLPQLPPAVCARTSPLAADAAGPVA